MRHLALFALVACACRADPTRFDGVFGRPVSLASGDDSPLPRLYFIDHGCPGEERAVGGCPSVGQGGCQPLLLDSLSPLTFLRGAEPNSDNRSIRFGRECLELRESLGLAADEVAPQALADAVARFRFRDLPVVRAPRSSEPDAPSWRAGDHRTSVELRGVLGGNLLRQFAVELRQPRFGSPRVALYGEFPGSERDLADDGFAFLPVQFPGRLLGRDLNDRCAVGDEDCALGGFDIQGTPELALEASRIVLDACVAAPPCGVRYDFDRIGPDAVGSCSVSRGPQLDSREDPAAACVSPDDPARGGIPSSLVVATGVPGLVLFDDSARRMFGPLESLVNCDAVQPDTRACVLGQDGSLSIAGWPAAPAPNAPGLARLRIRALALLPGLTRTRGEQPCSRMATRTRAVLAQCEAFVDDLVERGTIEETQIPYTAPGADSAVAVVGEARLAGSEPNPDEWLRTLVLPQTHPLALALRRDVAPEAVQPDGLIGEGVLRDTVSVLDYTDPNPGLRMRCLNPRTGDCLVAPACSENRQAACCFGLPLEALVEFIIFGDDTCCAALSADELREIQEDGFCANRAPP